MHDPGVRWCGSGHSSGCSENFDHWENENVPQFNAVFEGTGGHLPLHHHFQHKGEGTLELYSFLLCGNTPDDREQGAQVLKPGERPA